MRKQFALQHVSLALLVQWLPYAALGQWYPTLWIAAVSGAFAGGVYLGREIEQLWPHIGFKPKPEGIDDADVARFFRQGVLPLLVCAMTLFVAHWVMHTDGLLRWVLGAR